MKQFNFYINGFDLNEYISILIEQNGESSNIIKILDKKYEEFEKQHSKCSDVLLSIRNYLETKGFFDEIQKCDIVFKKGKENRGMENPYVPISERWKNENLKFTQTNNTTNRP